MAAIRGRIEQRREDYALSLHGAWQGERFARLDKLKPFQTYAKALTKPAPVTAPRPQTAAERLSIFHQLAASGVPLAIERIG